MSNLILKFEETVLLSIWFCSSNNLWIDTSIALVELPTVLFSEVFLEALDLGFLHFNLDVHDGLLIGLLPEQEAGCLAAAHALGGCRSITGELLVLWEIFILHFLDKL